MNEERFKVIDNSFSMWIVDTSLKEDKHEGAIYTAYDMCRKLNELHEENERLKCINDKLEEKNDGIKIKGLKVLAFYESKLKNVVGTEDFQSVRDEIWIVRQVLYEMGVINDE